VLGSEKWNRTSLLPAVRLCRALVLVVTSLRSREFRLAEFEIRTPRATASTGSYLLAISAYNALRIMSMSMRVGAARAAIPRGSASIVIANCRRGSRTLDNLMQAMQRSSPLVIAPRTCWRPRKAWASRAQITASRGVDREAGAASGKLLRQGSSVPILSSQLAQQQAANRGRTRQNVSVADRDPTISP